MNPVDLTGANWRKSSKSGAQGQCVEVATELPAMPGHVAVRHSQRPDAETILYTNAEWDAFLDGARNGEFNL